LVLPSLSKRVDLSAHMTAPWPRSSTPPFGPIPRASAGRRDGSRRPSAARPKSRT